MPPVKVKQHWSIYNMSSPHDAGTHYCLKFGPERHGWRGISLSVGGYAWNSIRRKPNEPWPFFYFKRHCKVQHVENAVYFGLGPIVLGIVHAAS